MTSPLRIASPAVCRVDKDVHMLSEWIYGAWKNGGRRGEETHKDTSFPSPCVMSLVLPFWKLDAFPNNSHFHGNDELPKKQRIPPLIFLHPVQSATTLTKQVTAGEINPKVLPCCNLSRIPAQSWAFLKRQINLTKPVFT